MPEYIIPAEEVEYEFVVQKSRFIAAIAPAFSVEDAKQIIMYLHMSSDMEIQKSLIALMMGNHPELRDAQFWQ